MMDHFRMHGVSGRVIDVGCGRGSSSETEGRCTFKEEEVSGRITIKQKKCPVED